MQEARDSNRSEANSPNDLRSTFILSSETTAIPATD